MKTEEEYNAEVLQLMRDLYPTLKGEEKERAERLFPELKESEDERMMNSLHSWMKEFGGAEEYTEKVYQWIKGLLENQCGQKQGWSEEDEAGLSDVLWAIEQARTIAKDENDMGNLWCAEHFAKSIKDRHTWKPSEQDILLLERIADGRSNPQDFQASLGGLIGELKKLKG